jgi:hypothetical protein
VEPQAVGRGQVGAAEREVVDPLDRETAELAGRRRAQPFHGGGDQRQVGDAHRDLVGGVQAVLEREVVQHVDEGAAGRLGLSRQLTEQQQG